MWEIFSEHNAKNFHLKISYRHREILKTEVISFSYDVNGYVYSKSKSIQLRTYGFSEYQSYTDFDMKYYTYFL